MTFEWRRVDVNYNYECDDNIEQIDSADGTYVLAEDAIKREAVNEAKIRTLKVLFKDAKAALASNKAAAVAVGEPITSENCSQRITDMLMECVERLGNFPEARIDGRVWKQLLVYVPKNAETNAPEGIEDAHFLALARMCKMIGNYTTMEQVNAVAGYARVVLNDKAVQEAFVRANRLPCATPPAPIAPTGDALEQVLSILDVLLVRVKAGPQEIMDVKRQVRALLGDAHPAAAQASRAEDKYLC